MKKTVCFVNTHYFPVLGGITQYTYNLIKEMQARNMDVILITLNVMNLVTYEVIEGVKIYRLPCINLMGGRFPVICINKKTKSLLLEIRKQTIELMIINARFYALSLYMARFAKKNKIYSIIIDHGSSHLTLGNKLATKVGECYEHLVTQMLKYYCKEFYGVSKASCNWLTHFGIQARGTLYNAVNLEFIKSVLESPTEDYKKQYSLPNEAVIIAFTGRLVAEKGILTLIEAIINVRKTYPNTYLVVAGDGPLRKQIEDKCDEGIILLGQVGLDAIISLLKQSYALCLPSASEGFPTSVLEAVACKCFVMATKIGGATEIIPTKDYGILLEENDSSHIEQAILYTITESDQVKKATEIAYQHMICNFTWKKTADEICRILKL